MDKNVKLNPRILLSVALLYFLAFSSTTISLAKDSPLTPRASSFRYWNEHISSNLSKPSFLFSKASPLSIVHSAYFAKLASQNSLSSHLSSFCSSANLFCGLGQAAETNSNSSSSVNGDANFAFYTNKHFSNYGNSQLGGVGDATFKNYSNGVNFATSSFSRYSRSSRGNHENFTSYDDDGNIATANFTSYSSSAGGGSAEFRSYLPRVNVPDLRFTSYDSNGTSHSLTFSSYSDDTNSGNQAFTAYAKRGRDVPLDFSSYAGTSNVIGSSFTGYGESGNSANDSFKGYSTNANNPRNNFNNYGVGGNRGIDSFTSYRDSANAGTDAFQSYGKSSDSARTNFANYGKSLNGGIDTFKGYGKGAKDPSTEFKIYGANNTFKDYSKKGVRFALYTNSSKEENQMKRNGKAGGKSRIEEGKFFRERMLKEGTILKMPNIVDQMPQRSFLPRPISSKLPFSTMELQDIKELFHAVDNSTMERVIVNALEECERPASRGETKQCVGSLEDMIDFAVSVLGRRDVVVRTTENVNGSGQYVMIGKVMGVNGGRVTKSVSCHQSFYPYLLYYCHGVPKVKVYGADILEMETKTKINHGIAICHLDTSVWSPGHGAFVELGFGPGLIEVCHWIFENDVSWTIAD